jgi:NAD(P)-dependent dehydrogenase (short-subunit alcohol dehydrogenase family)
MGGTFAAFGLGSATARAFAAAGRSCAQGRHLDHPEASNRKALSASINSASVSLPSGSGSIRTDPDIDPALDSL